jgi:hypothetical protein
MIPRVSNNTYNNIVMEFLNCRISSNFKLNMHNQTHIAEQCKQRRKQQRVSEYECTDHVIPGYNICERAITSASIFIHYLHAHMAPDSLELLLFLYCNKNLWNYAAVIDEAIAWEAACCSCRHREKQ